MSIPKGWKVDPAAAYLHITTNNTIKGTEYHAIPDAGDVPIIADMSSDFYSRKVDWSKFGMAYGGAQKNLGPAGASLVLIRKDMVEKARRDLPAYLRYDIHFDKESMYNTPPMFQIYMIGNTLEWVQSQGGLDAMDKLADERAGLIYGTMEKYPDYFSCPVAKEDRSRMNVCFRLPNEDLEKKFAGAE